MKVNESWLREWSGLDADKVSAEALGEQLTMAGLEIDDMSPVAQPFNNVVVGEVLTLEQHPDADKLRVTTVNVGADEPLQIVCGAPNVSVGMKAPVATAGAVLPNGLKIKKSKLRGVESNGMLCGASEIDLEDEIDGLMELPSDAPVGTDIREYLNLDEQVYDVSITPNRGDCFSVRGLVREIGVINETDFADKTFDAVSTDVASEFKVQRDTDDCPRYLAQEIRGVVANTASPAWLKQRLERSGLATHSLCVDVTNYVLMELGQPLHAFDADKVKGDIVVRYAKADEKLTLLNEQEVTLTDDVLVIADDSGAIAIAGIMGGLSTAVTDKTTNIILESAHFNQLAIAGRARRFGLHTDASQRFERGVDFEMPENALNRATALITEIAGGTACHVVKNENKDALPKRSNILLTAPQIEERLGFAIPNDKVLSILNRLDIITKVDETETEYTQWVCTPPSHRFDISIPVDLIEELVRIHGYDHIPVAIPSKPMHLQASSERYTEANITDLVCHMGYQEAISFSFSDEKIENALNPQANILALANPISADLAVMRSTLLSSLLPCVSYNINRKQSDVRLFETGLRFVGQDIANLEQIPTLAMVAVGNTNQEDWHGKPRALDFYDIKHDVNQLFIENGLTADYQPINTDDGARSWLHPGQSADILVDGQVVGYVGALHPSVIKDKAIDIDAKNVWVCEIDISALTVEKTYHVADLPKFPQVRRDLAILIDNSVSSADIISTIKQSGGALLQKAWVFDIYKDDNMPADKHSVAFGMLWQDFEKTLEDEETETATNKVLSALEQQFGASLRA